jgi:hypothetical protein
MIASQDRLQPMDERRLTHQAARHSTVDHGYPTDGVSLLLHLWVLPSRWLISLRRSPSSLSLVCGWPPVWMALSKLKDQLGDQRGGGSEWEPIKNFSRRRLKLQQDELARSDPQNHTLHTSTFRLPKPRSHWSATSPRNKHYQTPQHTRTHDSGNNSKVGCPEGAVRPPPSGN